MFGVMVNRWGNDLVISKEKKCFRDKGYVMKNL